MEQLFEGLYPVDRCSSYFFYRKDGVGSMLVYHLKYYRHPWVGEYLGRCMAQEIQKTSDFFKGVDMIFPLPLHPARQRQRGYNQCVYISQGIANVTGIPIVEDLAVRIRMNNTQTHKSRDERLVNVEDLFQLNTSCSLAGKLILLVDDVCTTGATLGALMEVFRQTPGVRFRILTLGVVPSLD